MKKQTSENNLLAEDAAARRQALDPAGSYIVQAPAGSGKTELLIQRILALLGVVQQPEEILAITFTRKAAGEMRERLFRALEGARGPEPEADHQKTTWRLAAAALENSRKQGWRLLEHPARLRVQTIDSFCANLVRRMPWLSRFGAQAAVTADATELYRRASERVLALADRDEAEGLAVRRLLAHLDNRAERLCGLLVAMLGRRDQWLRHLTGCEIGQQKVVLEKGLTSLAEQALSELDGCLPMEVRQGLAELGRFAGETLRGYGVDNSISTLAGLDSLPSFEVLHLDRWRSLCDLLLTVGNTFRKRVNKNCGFPPGKDPEAVAKKQLMADTLDALRDNEPLLKALVAVRQLPPVAYDENQWRILQSLVALLPRAVAELWVVFQETGQADFSEIAQAADRALGDEERPTDLMLHLDSRIRHILVDEFQDTSWGQFLLLKKLTSGWQSADGRSLFLVGDPMQSIYRFREAEVGLFLRARRLGIGTVRLAPLNLLANFRSQGGIVDWVNGSFCRLFPGREDETRGGVRYAPSHAVKQALAGMAVSVHPRIGRDDAAEAEQVVALVRQAMKEDSGGKIAILVRARGHLLEIGRALREAGMRYLAQEVDPLIDRPVARDLLALTRALLHPGDRVAHLAVLRAPWCGLSLSDLHALVGETPDRTVSERLRIPAGTALLSTEGRRRAERVSKVLDKSLAQKGREPLRHLVEGAWLALGGPACVDPDGREDAANIFDLLEELDYGGDLNPFEVFSDRLAMLYASPDPGADETLQLMTMHKAKGLEFDTVILPGLGRRPRSAESSLLRWLELPSGELLLAPIAPQDGQSRDPIYDAIGRLEKEKEDLEISRILYVAATRARKRLHLLGHAKSRGGESAPEPGSFMAKLWPVVEDSFSGLREGEEEPVDLAPKGIRELSRLPLDWQFPSLPAGIALDEEAAVLRPSALGKTPGDLSLAWGVNADLQVGRVCHALLERIATEGLQSWPEERFAVAESGIRHQLAQSGLTDTLLEKAVRQTMSALERTLKSPRGRWLLGAHEAAECELALSGVLDGRIVHGIVDRTFVDSRGVRWIIDYKLSEPGDLSEDAFLGREGGHYREQVTAYCRLMEALEPQRDVRAALYFPLFDGWYEYGGV